MSFPWSEPILEVYENSWILSYEKEIYVGDLKIDCQEVVDIDV